MNDKFDDQIKEISRECAIKHLRESFKTNGIEGTEQVINEVYKYTEGVRDYLLDIYYKILRREIQ